MTELGNACARHVQRIAIFSFGFRAEKGIVVMINSDGDGVIIVIIVNRCRCWSCLMMDLAVSVFGAEKAASLYELHRAKLLLDSSLREESASPIVCE